MGGYSETTIQIGWIPIAIQVNPVRVGIEPSNWNSIFTVIVTTTSDFCRG